MKIIRFSFDARDGRKNIEARLKLVGYGHVALETWGGENIYSVQHVSMQNGQTDIVFTAIQVDGPAVAKVLSFVQPHHEGGMVYERCEVPGQPVELVELAETHDATFLCAIRRVAKLISNGLITERDEERIACRIHRYLDAES